MIIFLTSSFVEYQPKKYIPKPLDPANGFVDNLKKYWKDNAKFLVFASDPADPKMVDHMVEETYDAFTLAGIPIGEIRYFDDRVIQTYMQEKGCGMEVASKEALREAMEWADVFYLTGGHAPTENAFMKRCDLKSLIWDRELFDGIFIGLSAGSVNAAKDVYLPPELPGEAIDPNFVKFTDGLGLTGINMMPHIEYERTVVLDGMKFIDEIVTADSMGREIYLIPDGAYFMIRNGVTEFFGEGEILASGKIRPLHGGIVHADNERIRNAFQSLVDPNAEIFRAVVEDKYDFVAELNPVDGRIETFHISKFWLEHGIDPIHLDTFDQLNRLLSEKLVVPEEKEAYVEQASLPVILDELERKGCYVRTFHLDDGNEIKADNLRICEIAGDERRLLASVVDISMVLDHDWMTDEYSRSGFIAQAENLLKLPEYREGYSLVYANVKGFKAVNDLLGLHSGDMVIFMVRDILNRDLEPILAARLESDHFALITRTEMLTRDRMEKMCHQCYVEESKQLPILIRCGIYHIEKEEMKVQHMLDRAKLAEKSLVNSHGKCYAVCDKRMSREYVEQRILASDIENAFEKKEFKTYYQPVVDAKTGELVSAEALVRWHHSEKGLISPREFISLFEREGQITRIDSFMVNNVLAFNGRRAEAHKRIVPCAVNLSRVDFYDVQLLELMKQKLKKYKNVRDMLKLEVTESAYAVLESDAISFLEEMKKLGLTLMLDDFGSGMSSLSTLETFEFDVIKLDMGFVSQIGKSRKAEAIIKHTIGLSHDIGAKVVAEGVEDENQLAFLRSVGCDMIQGYYFYKPMPEEEFEKLLDFTIYSVHNRGE